MTEATTTFTRAGASDCSPTLQRPSVYSEQRFIAHFGTIGEPMGELTFLTTGSYASAVRSAFSDVGSLDCAVAFWGKSAKQLLASTGARPLRIICNLESGATNPMIVAFAQKLALSRPLQIKTHRRLHAKVIIGPRHAIVGSANISTNGLALEPTEFEGWEEAGTIVRDQKIVDECASWFSEQWESAIDIDAELLAQANAAWKRRRPPLMLESRSLIELLQTDSASLKHKRLYLTVSAEDASSEAEREFSVRYGAKSHFDFYEDWDDLPANSEIIHLDYDPVSGEATAPELYRTPPDLVVFTFKVGNRGSSTIHICEKAQRLSSIRLTKEDRALLKRSLPGIWKRHWGSKKTTDAITTQLYAERDVLRSYI